MTSSSSNNIAYFNVHTEGLGYLDSLKRIEPNPGQNFTPFWSASFCMLEGDPKKPEKIYVSLSVPAEKVIEELIPFLADINGQGAKVFVGLRLAKFRGEPYIHGANSKTPGEPGVNHSARLIAVLYLKVGDVVVKLARDNQPATTDFGVPAAIPTKAPAQSPIDATTLFAQPLSVKLAKNDPDFEVTKQRLKDAQYGWHNGLMAWVKRSVVLDASDPAKEEQTAVLESMGYTSQDRLTWQMAFPKAVATSAARSSKSDWPRRANHPN